MPLEKRAAQFLPFSALAGLDSVMEEEARPVDERPELGEDALLALDEQLSLLRQRLSERPTVTVTRFLPDEKKDGGRYETVTCQVRRLDEGNHTLLFTDGTVIDLDTVVELTLVQGKKLVLGVDRQAGENLQ